MDFISLVSCVRHGKIMALTLTYKLRSIYEAPYSRFTDPFLRNHADLSPFLVPPSFAHQL